MNQIKEKNISRLVNVLPLTHSYNVVQLTKICRSRLKAPGFLQLNKTNDMKMAATDGQITLAASRFGDTVAVYLRFNQVFHRDFAKTDLPAVAKIVKGQHQNLGVPTLSNPSLQSTALFLNAGKKYQILAQPIKIKEGRKPCNVGPKVLIPETYPGYFELLSEDGRSTRCIDNVLDLSRKPNLRVLVRETFRCNHLMKTIHAGEILTTMYDNGKYLKCKTSKDEVINLPLETKAKFSPIAKEDSISGVHSVKNLLKKRLPVIVSSLLCTRINAILSVRSSMTVYSRIDCIQNRPRPIIKN
ncbi:hypothetical protein Bhyg_07853 [Pseudolycoriella hygida]|uniref:CABIT domain-containing protein n=1 Tax=Pseudolycoriella hygida TaxID=35572 RepID=A0A9Q0S2E1_9DIPT|nr:hypothetical protein Bhyg_07853 [Pseudolycoriella hygida]